MGRALPTRASVANVVAALKQTGYVPVNLQVSADGSFTCDIKVDAGDAPEPKSPPKWGQQG